MRWGFHGDSVFRGAHSTATTRASFTTFHPESRGQRGDAGGVVRLAKDVVREAMLKNVFEEEGDAKDFTVYDVSVWGGGGENSYI